MLCHHRHLLSMSKLRCEPTTSCHPVKPERELVQQDEREVLHKFGYPKIWRTMCPIAGRARRCVTSDADRIGLL